MSVASSSTTLMTADDLDQFPDDGMRREIIEGVLYVAAAPSRFHQEVLFRLTLLVGNLLAVNRAGSAYFAPVDVRFSDLSLVQPDLIFIRRERLGIYRGNTVHSAPDVVVEVVSPSNRGLELDKKAQLYEANAVPEYWVFHPERREVTQLVLVDGRHTKVEPVNGIYHSTVIPGLAIDPSVLFAPMDE